MNETELLFTEVLNCSRAELYLKKKRILSHEDSSRISLALRRRIFGEPIQYILGKTEFMGLEFIVNSAVLIPRPDTELLVETALGYGLKRNTSLEILDIGTGSGCIAVSLAKFLPQAKIFAVDISSAALEIARLNAKLNKVEGRIDFLNCDLFPLKISYDLIISNPPYIKTNVLKTLEVEVRQEPRIALDGGGDGLDFYREIFWQSPEYLKPNGLLMLEIGFDQKEAVEKIIVSSRIFEVQEVIRDYNNIDRVIVARLKVMRQ